MQHKLRFFQRHLRADCVVLRFVSAPSVVCLQTPKPFLNMENICLQFYTREQLLDFLKRTGTIHCTIDLKELTLCSRFTESELNLAIHSYQADMMVDSLIY
jgi:hypothetical protein